MKYYPASFFEVDRLFPSCGVQDQCVDDILDLFYQIRYFNLIMTNGCMNENVREINILMCYKTLLRSIKSTSG